MQLVVFQVHAGESRFNSGCVFFVFLLDALNFGIGGVTDIEGENSSIVVEIVDKNKEKTSSTNSMTL